MKESKQITLGAPPLRGYPGEPDLLFLPNETTLDFVGLDHRADGFQIPDAGKVFSIKYQGTGSMHKQFGRILRQIGYWHQGSIESLRILYQNVDGLGVEIAEVIAQRLVSA